MRGLPQSRFYQENLKGLHLIIGPMFAGKTSKVIEFVQQYPDEVVSFKPAIDTRYDKESICAHTGESIVAEVVNDAIELKEKAMDKQMVVIDEAQFFDVDLVDVIRLFLDNNKFIVVSGLNRDFKKNAFQTIEELKSMATTITELEAVCNVCGEAAPYTYKKGDKNLKGQVLVGGTETYEARCASCYERQ